MTTHVGLLGHPVAHSLSPRMQNAAFAARGLDWDYTAHDVEDALAGVASLRELGFAGANVTIPHKQTVVAACDEALGPCVARGPGAFRLWRGPEPPLEVMRNGVRI